MSRMPIVPEFEGVTPPQVSKPRKSLPEGACDTHAHVFGPYDVFPFVTPPSYPPPLAPFALYSAMLAQTGMSRGVLVQPAPYGTDNRALADALRRSEGKVCGIAVTTQAASEQELAALHAAGVRGLRFNEMIDSGTGGRFKGSVGVEQLRKLAPRMKELGWHAQLWARCEDAVLLAREIVQLGITVVFEHMASLRVERGTQDPGFRALLALLAEGGIWVKLSVCRNSKLFPDYEDVRPFHNALIGANPNRLLWASDWPFVRMTEIAPDVGHLVDLFDEWVGDAEIERKILVENPRALYGFK
jgi:predicted TIM-barrel fold metal-dependent hydrolase